MSTLPQPSRVTRTKSAARASYDRLSRWYDLISGSGERRLAQVALEKLAPQAGARVLEIGPGTGHALVWLRRSVGAAGAVFGVDISAGMLAQARQRLEKDHPRLSFNLVQGDGAWLPFRDASQEALFLSFTLELFDTPEIAPLLDECLRVLKTGGRIAVVSLALGEKPRWTVRLYEWFHAHFPNAVDCRPIHARLALEANGFEVLDYQARQLWGLPVEIVIAKSTVTA